MTEPFYRTHTTELAKPVTDRTTFMQNLIKDKVALHVGCAGWPGEPTLHIALGKSGAKRLDGIDTSIEGLNKLHPYTAGFLLDTWPESSVIAYDVILIPEVLEHTPNPGILLLNAHKHLTPDGILLVTVPDYCSFRNNLSVIKDPNGGYIYTELMHEDHVVAAYSPRTLKVLLERSNFKIEMIALAPEMGSLIALAKPVKKY